MSWPVRQWYAVARAKHVRHGPRPTPLTRFGQRLVLWRDSENGVHAASARCPHRGADLAHGHVIDGRLQCHYHGFEFAPSGQCVRMPFDPSARISPTLCLDTLAVTEAHGFIWLWHAPGERPTHPLPALPWLPEVANDASASASLDASWPAALSRVMESMLDIHHFPFAHRRFVPRSLGPLHPYTVSTDGHVIRTHGTLAPTTGKKQPRLDLHINCAFPALFHFVFSPKMQGLVVCCPIDEHHTWLSARYTQRYVTWPVLSWLVATLMLRLEFTLVQPDDLRLISTSQPLQGTLASSQWQKADRGAVEWYRLAGDEP